MAKAATATAPKTSASSFSDILKTRASDVERPEAMPVGDYVVVITGQPRQDKSAKKQTPFVEFSYKVLEAMESVDEEALDTWLTNKKGEKKKLSEVIIKDTYYLTDNSLWRLTDMLKACGVAEADENGEIISDKSLGQLIEEVPGNQLIVTMRHESFQDGSGIVAKVAGVAAVEK
jgi:hypothetical protein